MLHLFLICINQGLVAGKAKYEHDRSATQLVLGKPQWKSLFFFFSKKLGKIEALCFILLETQNINTFQ